MAIHAIHALDQGPPLEDCRHAALTIGNFDGVHRGHAALLTEARRLAGNLGGSIVALTFDPHPLLLLRPERFLPVLTTMDDRASLLQAIGADQVVILNTTSELLQLTPDEFFRQVQARLAPRALVEGPDFGFGHHRAGNVETLAELCKPANIVLSVLPPLTIDGTIVSSSRIRAALERGDVVAAARLLGRPYRLQGTVGTGAQRGRTLGFPTANLDPLTFAPGNGVYAVRVIHQGQTWPGAANIGPNPTFGEHARKVEVHLIDFTGDLYGQPLAVDFLERLRDTRPFAGVADLKEQLQRDVEQARRLTSEGNVPS